jgi:hypothetical protein
LNGIRIANSGDLGYWRFAICDLRSVGQIHLTLAAASTSKQLPPCVPVEPFGCLRKREPAGQ